MKRIISLTLAALMLVTLLLSVTSCEVSMEPMTGYTRLRDHIAETGDEAGRVLLDGTALSFASVLLQDASKTASADDAEGVLLVAESSNQTTRIVLVLELTGSPEKALLTYHVINALDGTTALAAEATVLLTHYTGNELVTFTAIQNIHPSTEQAWRESVTSMLNAALKVLDTYTTEKLDMNLHELGFIALSDKYMAPVESQEAEEDLGGAFSGERLKLAGLMIVQGIGMVFLVLAILWLVLLVFKKVFYKDPAKPKKMAGKSEDTPAAVSAPVAPSTPVASPTPVAPSAPVQGDDALVAAITAAVAAYIESDPALSSQFAGGFRVVSFKKKNGKTSWNH